MTELARAGYTDSILQHINAGKSFMGICVGLQVLFEGSGESPGVRGLGVIHGHLKQFSNEYETFRDGLGQSSQDSRDQSSLSGTHKSVPHIGWNSALLMKDIDHDVSLYGLRPLSKYYYVHSYYAPFHEHAYEADDWVVAWSTYGSERFVGAIAKENVFATQFHPEKSGAAGLRVLKAWLEGHPIEQLHESHLPSPERPVVDGLTRRVIACLDVRTNEAGDLVVTKGDQYDVREKSTPQSGGQEQDGAQISTEGQIRNLGKPIDIAKKYYDQSADEITFLNITSFRSCPVNDLPMLEILRQTSKSVFVPLTIGGGIKDTTNLDGSKVSALDVATLYFKSGADKVSIGSDAVDAAEGYYASDEKLNGTTAIETISNAYGKQAVVVSVDPKRVYVASPSSTSHHTIPTSQPGPNGEEYVWYQCTTKGGREARDMDVRRLVTAVEAMGAGEILLNCIDKDGTGDGFDLELVRDVKAVVGIPVIASSGAGKPEHFGDVFTGAAADAALGAGMVSSISSRSFVFGKLSLSLLFLW